MGASSKLEQKKSSWRKRNRMPFLRLSMVLMAVAFVVVNIRSDANLPSMTFSLGLIGLACILPMMTKN